MKFRIEVIQRKWGWQGPPTWLLYWNDKLYGHGLKDALLRELHAKLETLLGRPA